MANDEIVAQIKKIIKEKIRPVLVMDGGNIEFVNYTEDHVVQVKLIGACHGCPMAAITLKHSVEETLKEYISEISSVENLEFEEDELE